MGAILGVCDAIKRKMMMGHHDASSSCSSVDDNDSDTHHHHHANDDDDDDPNANYNNNNNNSNIETNKNLREKERMLLSHAQPPPVRDHQHHQHHRLLHLRSSSSISSNARARDRDGHVQKRRRKHRGGVRWWWCCVSVSHFLRSVFKDLKLLSVIMVVWLAIVILVMIEIGVFNNPTFVAWGPRPTLSFLHVPIDTSYKYGLLLIMIMVHTFVSGECVCVLFWFGLKRNFWHMCAEN
jgi:hypothetical protein